MPVPRGRVNDGFQLFSHWRGKLVHPAHACEPDSVAQDFRQLTAQIEPQQTPQSVHFGARPFPIFRRERV